MFDGFSDLHSSSSLVRIRTFNGFSLTWASAILANSDVISPEFSSNNTIATKNHTVFQSSPQLHGKSVSMSRWRRWRSADILEICILCNDVTSASMHLNCEKRCPLFAFIKIRMSVNELWPQMHRPLSKRHVWFPEIANNHSFLPSFRELCDNKLHGRYPCVCKMICDREKIPFCTLHIIFRLTNS